MFSKPDLLGVWGNQTKMHAIKIQKFRENKVFSLGTPRFEVYFQKDLKKLESF